VLAELTASPLVVRLHLTLMASAARAGVEGRGNKGVGSNMCEPFPPHCLDGRTLRSRAGIFDASMNDLKKAPVTKPKDGKDGKDGSGKNHVLLLAAIDELEDVPRLAQQPSEPALKEFLRVHQEQSALKASPGGKTREEALLYDVLRFALGTNRLDLVALNAPQPAKSPQEAKDLGLGFGGAVPPGSLLELPKHVLQFGILPGGAEAAFQARKAKEGSAFALHGAPLQCWYSIMRNGLRNLSNTALMTTGAACGPGIYLSTESQVSSGYCRGRQSSGWSGFPDQMEVLAVVEYLKGSTQQHHSAILTTKDETAVVLRYILVAIAQPFVSFRVGDLNIEKHYEALRSAVRPVLDESDCDEQLSLLRKVPLDPCGQAADPDSPRPGSVEVTAERQAARQKRDEDEYWDALVQKQHSGQASRLLMREVRNLTKMKEDGEAPFHIDMLGDSLYHWHVHLPLEAFPPDCPLRGGLAAFAAKTKTTPGVYFDVVFPSQYPFSPPFIRVIRPRFQFHTGHVTIGGSLCMELLTPSGWSPSFSFESVMVQIRAEMVAGNGQVDATRTDDYTEKEAKEAFNRVARQHGWM